MNTETGSTVVVADRFPVQLLTEGGEVVHSSAKVYLTRPNDDGVGRVLAYSAPDVVLYDVSFDRNASQLGPAGMDWVLDTPVGKLIVRPQGGCGCGNRLKGWIPQMLQPYRLGRLR